MKRVVIGFFWLVFFLCGQHLGAQRPVDSLLTLSHHSGHYSNPFYLKASYSRDATVRYSRGKGAMGGDTYRMPDSLLISSTTPMRLFFSDKDTSFTVELFYAINLETRLPIVSVAIDTIDMWDSLQGIYVPGPDIYYDSTEGFWLGNNFEKGWEKPVSVVMIDTASSVWVAQAAGMKIFGGMSKFYSEKSLRLISRRGYGQSRFRHKFFRDRERDSYKSIILRMSGQDYKSTRFRDALATQISKDFNIDIQEYQPALLFLNGENWGVYNLREKINARFVSESLEGGNESAIDLIQGHKTAESGSAKPYLEFWQNLKRLAPNTEAFRTMVDTSIDVQNFLNFHIAQIYLVNLDYRGNIRFWREAPHGKLRWIMYDTDYAFGKNLNANRNFLAMRLSPVATAYHNPPWSTYPLRRLMEDSVYRHEFVLQSCYAMSEIFSTSRVLRYIDAFEDEYYFDIKNNHPQGRWSTWVEDIKKIRRFAEERPAYYLDHLAASLGCDERIQVVFNNPHSDIVEYQINNNRWVNHPLLEGTYFKELSIPWQARVVNHYYYLEQRSDTIIGHDVEDSIRIIFNPVPRELSEYNGQILLNEIRPHKDSTKQWMEFVLRDEKEIDFAGWSIITKHGQSYFKDTVLSNEQVIVVDSPWFASSFFNLSKEEDYVFLLDGKGHLVDVVFYEDGRNHPFVFRRIVEEEIVLDHLNYVSGEGSPGEVSDLCVNHWINPSEVVHKAENEVNYIMVAGFAVGALLLVLALGTFIYRQRKQQGKEALDSTTQL